MAGDAERLQLGTQPIPGDKPTGSSCRYETEFELLSTELDKLESLTDSVIDWRSAAENAANLLRGKSKDMLVAAYYSRTLYEQEGWAGFSDGLAVLRDMMKNFWDGLFPEASRMRARASALQWLADKMTPIVESMSGDGAALKPSLEALNEIIAFSETRFEPGEGPSLRALARAREERVAPAAGPAAAEGGAAEEQAVPAGGARGPLATRDDAYRMLEEVVKYLRRTEPHSPVIYLVERAVKWKGMSLQEIITELLVTNRDVRNQIWQQIGVEREQG